MRATNPDFCAGERDMKQRRSPRVIGGKSNGIERKRSANGRNGRNGGNGHDGEGQIDEKLFEAQPVIETLLGHRDRSHKGDLDKAQLLAALTALKKGEFSVRLPIDLDN